MASDRSVRRREFANGATDRAAAGAAPSPGRGGSACTPTAPKDLVLLHRPTEDGEGYHVFRAREGRLEQGEVRPVKPGRPLLGNQLVRLRPYEQAPWLCEAQVVFSPGAEGEAGAARDAGADLLEVSGELDGPAQVATPRYRAHWETIFGSKAAKTTSTPN